MPLYCSRLSRITLLRFWSICTSWPLATSSISALPMVEQQGDVNNVHAAEAV